jgi:hypothetical protein
MLESGRGATVESWGLLTDKEQGGGRGKLPMKMQLVVLTNRWEATNAPKLCWCWRRWRPLVHDCCQQYH